MNSFFLDISVETIFKNLSLTEEEDEEGAVAVGMDITNNAINVVVIEASAANVVIGLSSFAFRPCIVKSQ
jgi:hypothetical protein